MYLSPSALDASHALGFELEVINRFADYSEAEYRALLGQRRTWRPEVKAGQDHYCIM